MKKVIVIVLCVTPFFASAQGVPPAVASKPPVLQAAPEKKTDVYRTIADELLKNCEGTDKKIAVAGFSYSDGRDSRDGGVIAERITTELVKAKKFKVIERKEIEKVFEELKLQRSGAINPDSAKEIGKMLGADWVIVGTLIELPDKRIELNTRVVAVESGEILSASSGELKKDWLEEYKKLLIDGNIAVVNSPKDAQTFYDRGTMYSDLGLYDNAVASFGIAINIEPTYAEAYFGRGKAYEKKGEDDKAIQDYSKAIVANPLFATAYYNRGNLYRNKADPAKAIEDYSEAIKINPKYFEAYSKRGNAYDDMRAFDKAIDDYTKAISIDPNDAMVYSDRAAVYREKGESGKAAADEKKSRALFEK